MAKRSKISTVEESPLYKQREGQLCRHPEHMKRVPLTEFNVNTQNLDGLHSYCKACRSKIRRKYYVRMKAKRKAS